MICEDDLGGVGLAYGDCRARLALKVSRRLLRVMQACHLRTEMAKSFERRAAVRYHWAWAPEDPAEMPLPTPD